MNTKDKLMEKIEEIIYEVGYMDRDYRKSLKKATKQILTLLTSEVEKERERLMGEIKKKIPKKTSIKKVHEFYKPRIEDKKMGVQNTMAYDYSAGMVNGRNQTIDEVLKALSDIGGGKI